MQGLGEIGSKNGSDIQRREKEYASILGVCACACECTHTACHTYTHGVHVCVLVALSVDFCRFRFRLSPWILLADTSFMFSFQIQP